MKDLNYIKLFFTIMFAITFAILIAGTTFKLWFEYDVNQVLEATSLALQESQKDAERGLLDRRIAAKKKAEGLKLQQAIEAEELKTQQAIEAMKRKRIEWTPPPKPKTCDYWKTEYQKKKGIYEEQMMESACMHQK